MWIMEPIGSPAVTESVSVIVPVYNGEAFLREAIDSIRAQTEPVAEIVVVDDGSTDTTARLCAGMGTSIRYVRQENQGPAKARNAGLAIAHGDLIAFLDADDWWTPRAIATLRRGLRDEPPAEISLGLTQLMLPSSDGSGWTPWGSTWPEPSLCSALFRRSVLTRLGGLDESLTFAEDFDLFLRAWEEGVSVRLVPEVTRYYRRHEANMTHRLDPMRRDWLRSFHMSIQRRKARRAAGLPDLAPPDWLREFRADRA
jgi:glycosyltransferase involved in cell wall biosynthesis